MSTRSRTRKTAEEKARLAALTRVADSGIISETPASPSVVSRPEAPAVVPVYLDRDSARCFDHSEASQPPQVPQESDARSSATTSSKAREAARLRVEYEAEQEALDAKMKLIEAKKKMQLAEIDADDESEHSAASRGALVEKWVDLSPFAPPGVPASGVLTQKGCAKQTEVGPPAECSDPRTGHVRAEGDEDDSPDDWQTPADSRRIMHRQASGHPVSRVTWANCEETPRDRAQRPDQIEQLVRRLADVAPRRGPNLPKSFYELPIFSGGSADWLFFMKRYEDTTKACGFSQAENIFRLQAAVQGQAKALVEDLIRTSTDPREVISALDRMYGSPELLLSNVINKVRSLGALRDNDSAAIRVFSATVRSSVSVLKSLKAESYVNNPQIFKELLNKLTPAQRTEYGRYARSFSNLNNVDLRVSPTLEVFVQFLEELADTACYINTPELTTAAASTAPSRPRGKTQSYKVNVVTSHGSSDCSLCKGRHQLFVCKEFLELPIDARWAHAKEARVCFKCLNGTHNKLSCRAKRCPKCNYPHHSLLHKVRTPASAPTPVPSPQTVRVATEAAPDGPNATGPTLAVNYQGLSRRAGGLLKIVPITFYDGSHKRSTYALLDDGATVSLIDQELVTNSGGKIEPLQFVSANGQVSLVEESKCVFLPLSGENGATHVAALRTVPGFKLPSQTITADLLASCPHLRDLPCAELRDAVPRVLLGQDNWELLVGSDLKRGKSGLPVASLTALGWVVHGTTPRNVPTQESVCNTNELNDLIRAQFEIDALGVSTRTRCDPLKQRALELLENTCKFEDGQWHVGLLWNQDDVTLPDNYRGALSRLYNIERKMDRDPNYAKLYEAQITRLVMEGYAHKLDTPLKGPKAWYLPHFGVQNIHKPGKLRLVYDAAASFQGTSLNDKLMSGPDLLNPLLGVLFRFRTKRVAVIADIADMFLRVKISKQDRAAQMFLWRGRDRSEPPAAYVMSSMLFGAASSPTSAIYVLNKNAERFGREHPEAVDAIVNRLYMDDYLDSMDDAASTINMCEQIKNICAAGNFEIRGWVSNDPEVRAALNAREAAVSLTKLGNDVERTLGLKWDSRTDMLGFDVSLKKLRSDIVNGQAVPTKREFLSAIMSVYDPLGLLSPLTIEGRMILQQVWKSEIGWDDRLNVPCYQAWLVWLKRLKETESLTIPRWYQISGGVTMHVFGDAGERAYGAVVYFVDDQYRVALIAAKARVVSIPRLELQAAVLACRLAATIESEHGVTINCRVYWSDSRTVLSWIRSDPKDYKPFVAHRLAEIETTTDASQWRWVPSELNPADYCTKAGGVINDHRWLSGPNFIAGPPAAWPPEQNAVSAREEDPELHRVHAIAPHPPALIDVTRFSSWTRAVRTLACVLTFVRATRGHHPDVTAALVERAESLLIRWSQRNSFPEEFRAFEQGLPVKRNSKLKAVDPFMGDDGLLRVGGRLSHANAAFQVRHPVIMAGDEPTTRLLIDSYHRRASHANKEAVVNEIRSKYYVTRLRRAVSSVAAACQLCRVRRAQPNPPKMADLPACRLQHHQPAFSHCGLDYFGPVEVLIGRRREKRWVALFTCLTVRAIHVEIATSLSADSAIQALRRFIARRGQPVMLYTDRGTNFVGAARELKESWGDIQQALATESATRKIRWSFISPASPHMGGCWERMVRSVKAALGATLRGRVLREETLHTLLVEAEAVVNNRPLTHVPVGIEDPVALTPNHLLLGTGAPPAAIGRFDHTDAAGRKQWRITQALADLFWARWMKEYLPTLQRRNKWTDKVPPLQLGDLVVITDPALPRNVWPRGRVVHTFAGRDGQVRVANVATKNGIVCRPVTRLAVLPTDSE